MELQAGTGSLRLPAGPVHQPKPTPEMKEKEMLSEFLNWFRSFIRAVRARLATTPTPEAAPMQSHYNPMRREQLVQKYIDVIMAMAAPTDEKRAAADELIGYKKARKLSWNALGVTPTQQEIIERLASVPEPDVKISRKVQALSARMKPAETQAPKLSANDNIRLERDKEVARLAGLGKTTTEIHRATGVPRRTVDRIRDKLSA